MAHCVGTIGMSIEEYNDSTYGEILCVMAGYRNKVLDQARVSWEQARTIAYYAVAAHVKPGTIKSPEALFSLAWDKGSGVQRFDDSSEGVLNDLKAKLQFRLDEKRRKEIKQKVKGNGRKSR